MHFAESQIVEMQITEVRRSTYRQYPLSAIHISITETVNHILRWYLASHFIYITMYDIYREKRRHGCLAKRKNVDEKDIDMFHRKISPISISTIFMSFICISAMFLFNDVCFGDLSVRRFFFSAMRYTIESNSEINKATIFPGTVFSWLINNRF
jgi:hypothetical protein